MIRLGVLASGGGTNLQAILDACAARRIDAEVAVVVSNVPTAGALDRARRASVEAVVIPSKGVADREAYDLRLVEALRARRVDLVCLAGYMRLLSPAFIAAFPHRILNIHPSLLPAFPGVDAQAQAIAHGVKISGCTVHFVDENLDAGPIIVQRAVEVRDGDSAESLAARILEQEHIAYVEALNRLATRRWRIEGRRVVFQERTG